MLFGDLLIIWSLSSMILPRFTVCLFCSGTCKPISWHFHATKSGFYLRRHFHNQFSDLDMEEKKKLSQVFAPVLLRPDHKRHGQLSRRVSLFSSQRKRVDGDHFLLLGSGLLLVLHVHDSCSHLQLSSFDGS